MKNSILSVVAVGMLAAATLMGASKDVFGLARHSAWRQGDFAGKLYRQLADAKDNLAFSPYGVASVCALVGAGAKGETAAAFKNIIGLSTGNPDEIARIFGGLPVLELWNCCMCGSFVLYNGRLNKRDRLALHTEV